MNDKEILKLFNEQIAELEKSEFLDWMKKHNFSVSLGNILKGEKERQKTRKIPSRALMVDFVAFLRPFFLHRDAIYIEKIATIYKKRELSSLFKTFTDIKKSLDDFLDEPPKIKVSGFNLSSNRKIFETPTFGKFTHVKKNATQRNEYKKWSKETFLYDFVFHWFCIVLIMIYDHMVAIGNLNKKAIKIL